MEYWYHGTPDVTGLEKEGGFTSRNISVEYLKDIRGYYEAQSLMKKSRESGDEETYEKAIDSVPSFKDNYVMRKPVFLTNNYNVAKTYADPRRASDYQNAREKVLEITLKEGNVVTIIASGDRFRFIEVSKVKRGFVNAGVTPSKVDELIERLVFAQSDKTRMKTNAIAVLGEWFGFDYIDVIGVLDSYHGGSVKSTVRMVFDVNKININNNNMSENKLKGGLADNKTIHDIVLHHGKDSWASIQFESLEQQLKIQLEKGIKHEMEHTDDIKVATEIAMDHLWEDKKYYDKLESMEKNENIKESFDEYSNDALTDMIVNLSRFEGNEEAIQRVKQELNKRASVNETKNIIKKFIKEDISSQIIDETPESIDILILYNGRKAGVIMVTPSTQADKTLEVVGIRFKDDYRSLFIINEAIKELWVKFKNINDIIVAPKPEGIQFWNKLGFNRISPNYLIKNRGH